MPKITNPVVKSRIRQALLEGKSDKAAILAGGLSVGMAGHEAKNCKVLNLVKTCLIKEFKATDITVEYVLRGLKDIAENGKQESNRVIAYQLLGKYLALFTDRQIITHTITSKEEQQSRVNRLKAYFTSSDIISTGSTSLSPDASTQKQ